MEKQRKERRKTVFQVGTPRLGPELDTLRCELGMRKAVRGSEATATGSTKMRWT